MRMHTAVIYIFLLVSGLVLSGCDSFKKPVPPIDRTDQLVVITVKHTDNFYKNTAGGYSGLTVDLVTEFARGLGLKTKFIIVQRPDEALYALKTQQGHLVVGLSPPPKGLTSIRLGPVYLQTQHQVAYNTSQSKPKAMQYLVGKNIEVPIDSIYEYQLTKINQRIPKLTWSKANISSDHLLVKLAKRDIEFTISNSSRIKRIKLFYPNVKAAFNLDETIDSQWIFSQFSGQTLVTEIKKFFARIKHDGTLIQLMDRHNGHLDRLSAGDIHFFLKKMRKKLPSLRKYFYQAEALTGIDWRLIAALAYQESHWNPLATSPTGVRGIMMLTRKTAKRMKVKDRLNLQQSILGGAKYLLLLRNKLSRKITEPDRSWMALAAYNQGYGSILDARMLARRSKMNPDFWVYLKKTLPLLSQKKYFDTLKYGRARGKEAVNLTESVRAYYDILKQHYRRDSPDPTAFINTVSLP